jgi:hypothetical protein
MEDGDSKPRCIEEATRAEAIAHVVKANSYEDPKGFEEKCIELEWLSRGADGERCVLSRGARHIGGLGRERVDDRAR